jgi:phosphoribosyl 1,2-cyclic phosphate phosphodiesterase
MKAKLLFLGTGASTGVPMIGCSCSVCRSSFKKNKRLRPSLLLTAGCKKILIDVAPDFREMALKYKIHRLDGLLLTHVHYDHIGGLDELRVFYLTSQRPLPCLLSQSSYEEVKERYAYLFKKKEHKTSLSVELEFHILKKAFGKTIFQQIPIGYFSFHQRKVEVTGFRFQDAAYVTDISDYSETEMLKALRGVKILILSALREDFSPVHFNFKKALAFIEKVKPEKAFLTHLAHEVDHKKASKKLPPGVELAYDGLEIEFDYAGKSAG